ncbi:MAG: N-acetyl-alpha-D-glucosaminyl L-malate synthase BshA [Crocinitomicaceae bacterium]|nr:N-acetyl-alpha-D-glucosaminyl L-malate synthase BshA [Crocinitomicaceae bacterium]
MKIGMVLYPTYGGSGVVATELGKALAEKGNEVHFITYSQPVRLHKFTKNIFYHEVLMSNYPLFDYPPYETELASKIVDVVLHENLDILHVHYAIPHASAAFMAQKILKSKGLDIPYITTLHGTDITLVGKSPSFEPVISFCINSSSYVTAVSESLKKDTLSHFEVKKEVLVIPNFVIKSDDSKTINRNDYAVDNQKILCHVSNFRPVKRIEDVIKIFSIVSTTIDSKLILIGDGPERYKAESLCREMNLCDKIIFIGKVPDTAQFLKIADLFLLPSQTESFGLAALEAMVEGVPVISSNSGGLPEVNIDNVTGFTSEVSDISKMAQDALKLLENKSLWQKMSNACQKRAELFCLENILEQYEKLYFFLKK